MNTDTQPKTAFKTSHGTHPSIEITSQIQSHEHVLLAPLAATDAGYKGAAVRR